MKNRISTLFATITLLGVCAIASDTIQKLIKLRRLIDEKIVSDPKKGKRTIQTEANGKIEHITFHVTDTGSGTGSVASEINIIKTIDVKKHGGVPYHFIIGNSGTVYQTRPTSIVPASNTYYFPSSGDKAPTKYKDATGKMDPDEHWNWYSSKVRKSFDDWKRENPQSYKAWLPEAQKELANDTKKGTKDELTMEKLERQQGLSLLAPGHSQGHITIAFLCKVSSKEENPTPPAYNAASRLAAELLHNNDLPLESIRVHYEIAHTDCPGPEVYEWLRVNTKDGPNRGPRKPAMFGDGIYTIGYYLKELKKANLAPPVSDIHRNNP